MDCLDPNLAAEFIAGTLDPPRRLSIESHMDRCPDCRELLVQLARIERVSGPPPALSPFDSTEPAAPDGSGGPVARVARFELADQLGEGGMGVVHRARDPETGDWVALKVVAADDCTPTSRQRFQGEAAAVRALDHPNIVRVLDTGETEDGLLFLAMELLEGENLAERIARGPLDPRAAAEIGIAIAAGLETAHAHGLVHRDVKPGNVFLCADGRIKLLDFGLAVPFGACQGARFTAGSALVGTPAFMALEQLRGQRDEDARTDVWGLGATLYAAVAGRPPYGTRSLAALALRLSSEPPDPLPEDVPAWFAAAIGRALQRDRSARWARAADLAEALTAGLGQGSERARDPATGSLSLEVRVLSVLWSSDLGDTGAAAEAVEREGGIAIEAGPDSVIGVFGGSVWLGDEPARAVRAALAARAANRGAEIGVATVRSSFDRDGVLVDSALASVRAASAVEGVGVDVETLRRIRGGFVLGDGMVLAERPGQRILGVRGLGAADTPLHGRSQERARLGAALERSFEGRGAGGALLVGPAGIGKSRLRHAVESDALERHPDLDRIACRGGLKAAAEAWDGIASGLRPYLEVGPGTPVDVVSAELVRHFPRLREPGPLAQVLAGVWVDGAGELEDAQARGDRVLLGVGDVFEDLLARGPVLLVVENAESVDRASLRAVSVLLRRFGRAPLFVLVTARAAPAVSMRTLERIELGPLALEATRAIVEETGCDGAWAEAIHERSGGNPLFTEELALAARSGRAELPMVVEGAVQARLDELPRAEKNLLRRASIFGARFSVDGLAALGQSEASTLLSSLRRRDLVLLDRGTRVAGEGAWRFRHPLLQEIAYASLTDPQREELHGTAGRWLAGRVEAAPAEVATHLERGGLGPEAAPYMLRAAEGALWQGEGAVALAWAERARPFFSAGRDAVRLAALRVDASIAMGAGERTIEDHLAELERLAETDADRTSACQRRVLWLRASGRVETAAAAARRGLERAPADVGLLSELGLALLDAGDPEGAATAARCALDRAEALDDPTALSRAASALAMCRFRRGELGPASVLFHRALDASERAGHARRIAGSLGRAGACLVALGAAEDACLLLERVLGIARALGLRISEGYALQNLGVARARRGDLDEGLATLEEALATARDIPLPPLYLETLRCLSLVLWEAGRPSEGLAAFARVPAEWADQPTLSSAETLALRALLSAATGDTPAARALAERALGVRAQAGGMGEFEAELFLAAAAVGIPDALEQGRRALEARASAIGDPGLRESFRTGIPANALLLGTAG